MYSSAHYWILSGLALAIPLYSPSNSNQILRAKSSIRTVDEYLYPCVAVWFFAEVSNFVCHLTLRNLRPQGTKKRALPTGYGFDLATSANYTFEILGWLAFSAMTLDWAGAFLTNSQ